MEFVSTDYEKKKKKEKDGILKDCTLSMTRN